MIRIMTSGEYSGRSKIVKSPLPDVSEKVSAIIARVKEHGDAALRDYALEFDGVRLEEIEVDPAEISRSAESVSSEYIRILSDAAENIMNFHERQKSGEFMYSPRPGIILGQRAIPIKRAGIYVPGGTAAYPSSVLMNAIPAHVAGVEEIIMSTPNPSAEILAAAKIAGVSRVFRIGGAQAIAAMAYGTKTVPSADKITGPGNIYVAEAKRQVSGDVGIDMTAGPSEIMIIADKNNYPAHIAADMLAQAEHDPNASAVLLTPSRRMAQAVSCEIENRLPKLPRYDTARKSIDSNGAIILVKNIYDAADIANDYAPEHLELCVDNPFEYMTYIRRAGSIFIGRNSPEALGDYWAGVNHILPTMGTARFSSPLSVSDFVTRQQYVYYSEGELSRVSRSIESFAASEGLSGHAESISIRRE